MATDVLAKIRAKSYTSLAQARMAVNRTKLKPRDKKDLIALAEERYSEPTPATQQPMSDIVVKKAPEEKIRWLHLAKAIANGILGEDGLAASAWAEKYPEAFKELATEYRVDITLHTAKLLESKQ